MATLRLRNGLTRAPKAMWPSEPGFIAAMNQSIRELEADLNDIFDQFEEVSAEITVKALEPTLEKSKEYCPKKTHALVNSAYLEITEYRKHRGTGTRVEMGYAKNGTPRYAAEVHENLDQKHAYPTQAKFLERAVMEDLGGIESRIASEYMAFAGM